MTFALSLSMSIKPDQMEDVLELLGTVMNRVQQEEGCLAFEICVSDIPNTLFIYEAYISEQYHDEVHEAYPEVRNVLAKIGAYATQPWELHRLVVAHARR